MLSVVTITQNEEEQIERLMRSVSNIADEIILVDHYSTDNTKKIAMKYGADVYTKEWNGFGSAFNYGFNKASGEWILYLAADESLSQELKHCIKRKNLSSNNYNGYELKIVNYICGIKTRWTKTDTRLFKKSEGKMTEDIHEKLVLDNQDTEKLDDEIIHDTYPTVSESLWKLDRYTREEAKKSNKNPSKYEFYIRPALMVINLLFRKRVILDGRTGIFIAMRKGFYELTKQYRKSLKSQGKIKEATDTADYTMEGGQE